MFRWRTIAISVGAVVVALAVHSALVVAQPSAATTRTLWEYKSVQVPNPGMASTTALNELGADGWELVSTVKLNETPVLFYVLKRSK